MAGSDEAARVGAKRDLYREEMSRFGGELSWLHDPSEIPEGILASSEGVPEQCYDLAMWMLDRLTELSVQRQGKLSWGETFEKHKLPNEQRVEVRSQFQQRPAQAYAPGITAMAAIFAVTPSVALREGIGREGWGEIGGRSQAFGKKLSYDGTDAQSLIRTYLQGSTFTRPLPQGMASLGKGVEAYTVVGVWDPGKIRLDDETGITTVTPFEDMLEQTDEILDEHVIRIGQGTCVALQAASPSAGCSNMFEAIWSAYGQAVDSLIYSEADEAGIAVVPAEPPDAHIAANIRRLLEEEITKAVVIA